MSAFEILSGKSLANAIKSFGKNVATFTARTHQLAYSALNHVEEHHDACHLNAVYATLPVNYRSSLVQWASAYGKVTFDAKALTFTYAKGKASDLAAALATSPADFVKAAKGGDKAADTVEAAVASLVKRLEAITEKGGSVAPRVMQAAKGIERLLSGEAPAGPVEVEAPKAAKAKKAKAAPAAAKQPAAAVPATVEPIAA